RLLGISLSILALLSTPALAGNFEFAVAGEPGLRMSITGYEADGTTLFETSSGSPELRDGKLFHTFRVDDTFLADGVLAKWCVEEVTGKWSALAGSAGTLCDEEPSETRGRYVFEPSGEPIQAIAAAPEAPAMTAA